MKKKTLQAYLLFTCLLVIASLACSTFNRANDARQTAQAVITEVQGLASAAAPMIGTAQAFATENPSLVETARSFTTTQGPSMLATAQAFATQNPGAMETARAMITELPGVIATGVNTTPVGGSTSPLNPDIPVLPESQRSEYNEYDRYIGYQTALSLEEMTNYYKAEMPVYDWLLDTGSSSETSFMNYLVFKKGDRTAQVSIIQAGASEPTTISIILTP